MKMSIFLEHLLRMEEQAGLSLGAAVEAAQEVGLQAVECSLAELESEEVRGVLRSAGMGVSGIYTSFDFRRKDLQAEVRHLLERAKEVEAGCVMPLPGLLREGENREAIRQVMAEGIAGVCEAARPLGVQVVLEDFGSPKAPFGRLEELEWFLQAVPELGCAFDSGNFRIHAQDAVEAYERLRKRIRHVHLKSWVDSPIYGDAVIPAADGYLCYPAPVGEGCVPNDQIVRRLLRDGYEGFCALEHFDVRDQLSCMRQAVPAPNC